MAIVESFFDCLLGCLHVSGVDVDGSGKSARFGLLVFVVDFSWDRVNRIDLHCHGQFAHVAVVEHTSARSYFKGALLLLLRFLNVFGFVDDLQPEQAHSDGESPKKKNRQTSQKRACFMGTARGVVLRVRLARSVAACMVRAA